MKSPEILLNYINVVLKAIERCWTQMYFKRLKPYDVLKCINNFYCYYNIVFIVN